MIADHNDSKEARNHDRNNAVHESVKTSSDATQGYSADEHSVDEGNTSQSLIRGFKWFRQSVTAHIVVLFVLAVFIEVGIFNHWSFWHSLDGYQRVNVNTIEDEGKDGSSARGRIINSPDSQAVVINNIRIRPRNLLIKVSSDQPQMVEARVEFLDRGSRHRFVPASIHRLNTSGTYARSLFHFEQRDEYIYGLRIIFTSDHDSSVAPVYLTQLSFNVPEHVQISWLRLIFMLVVFNAVYLLTVRRAWFNTIAPTSSFRHVPLIAPAVLASVFAAVIYGLQSNGISAVSNELQQDLLGSMALIKMIMSLATVSSLTWAMYSMLRYFRIETGAVLTAVSAMAVICGSQLFYNQMDLLKESISPVLITLMLTMTVGSLYSWAADSSERSTKNLWIGVFGVALMLTALSRAWAVLLTIALCLPLIISACEPLLDAVRSNERSNLKKLYRKQLTLPAVIAGSLVVSVIIRALLPESFMTMMLSAVGGNPLTEIEQVNHGDPYLMSIENFVNALHYTFFEPLSYSKNFPFVLPSSSAAQSFGVAISVHERISIMALPFAWLSLALLLRAVRARAGKGISLMTLAALAAAALYAWGSFYLYGVGAAQSAPASSAVMLASALTVMALFSRNSSTTVAGTNRPAQDSKTGISETADSSMNTVVFVLTMFLALKSIVIGMMLPFAWGPGSMAGQFLRSANLDAMLYLDQLFNSISF